MIGVTHFGRRAAVLVGVAGLAVWGLQMPVGAQATPATYKIIVNNTPPAGHNLEYTDFFPRTGVEVHNGDVIDFNVPAGISPDSTNIVALLKQGETADQGFADPANALVLSDSDEPGATPILNLAAFGGTHPPPGFGAPGACGDQTTPCSYDGTSELVSGENFPGDFFVKLSLPSGFTGSLTAIDIGHPNSGNSLGVDVVAYSTAASTQSALDSAAASQYQSDTSAALAAEAAANHDSVTNNANGTHTHHVSSGASTQYAEILEFLPQSVQVSPGDSVTWTWGGRSDPSSVIFPAGPGGFPVSPFNTNPVCEGPSSDTAAPNPQQFPDFGCSGGPAAAENAITLNPLGPTAIRRPAYRLVTAAGGIFDFGQAAYHGSAHPASRVVATASTQDQGGYYEATATGGVFTFGDAAFRGSMAGKHLSAPIVGVVAVPNGYGLIGADGAVYRFGGGNAGFNPSLTHVHLTSPIVGALTSLAWPGPGAEFANAAGGVFTVGSAPFFGSLGGRHLANPIVGIQETPDGGGYWLVGAGGAVFTFGDADFFGALAGKSLPARIVGMTITPDGGGYWLVGANGSVYPFGNAVGQGSLAGHSLASPVVGIDTAFTEASSGFLGTFGTTPNDVPSRATYTALFPDTGSFDYMSGFESNNMFGTVGVH